MPKGRNIIVSHAKVAENVWCLLIDTLYNHGDAKLSMDNGDLESQLPAAVPFRH